MKIILRKNEYLKDFDSNIDIKFCRQMIYNLRNEYENFKDLIKNESFLKNKMNDYLKEIRLLLIFLYEMDRRSCFCLTKYEMIEKDLSDLVTNIKLLSDIEKTNYLQIEKKLKSALDFIKYNILDLALSDRSVEHYENSSYLDFCSICKNKNELIYLICRDAFHVHCLYDYLLKSNKCFVCGKDVVDILDLKIMYRYDFE